MNLARVIFILSVALSVFWVSGLLAEAVTSAEPSVWLNGGLALSAGLGAGWRLYKSGRQFLLPMKDHSPWPFYLAFLGPAYVVSVPVGAGIGYLYLWLAPGGTPVETGESSMLVWLAAVWLPLWWSPALGLSLGWRFYRRKVDAGSPP